MKSILRKFFIGLLIVLIITFPIRVAQAKNLLNPFDVVTQLFQAATTIIIATVAPLALIDDDFFILGIPLIPPDVVTNNWLLCQVMGVDGPMFTNCGGGGNPIIVSTQNMDCAFPYQPTFYIPQFSSTGSQIPIPGSAYVCGYNEFNEPIFCYNYITINKDTDKQVAIYRFSISATVDQATLNNWYFNIKANVGNGFLGYYPGIFNECPYPVYLSSTNNATPLKFFSYAEECSDNVCNKVTDLLPENSYVVYVAKMLGDYTYYEPNYYEGVCSNLPGVVNPNKFLNKDNSAVATFPDPTVSLGNTIVGPILTGSCPTCANGATNPPACDTCPSGQTMVSGSCVSNCANGATNPPTCNTCTAPLVWNGSSCSSAPKPHIVLSPTTFTFGPVVSGGATPAGQTLNISNTGNAALNWTGSTNQGWCHLSSGSGSIAVGSNSNVTVSVDAPTNVGSFPCAITISDANADNSPQITSVTYTVTPVYNCERCSTVNNYTYVNFQSNSADCSNPFNVVYTCQPSCGIVAGNQTYDSCTAAPVYNCERCSTVNNYTYVNFQSNSADCSNPFNVVYTCQPSCGIVAGNQTYDSCTAALLNNASCIGITAPNSVTAGQSFSATVTMSNTGTKPWTTDASPHKLGSQNPQDNLRWGLGRVGLPSSPINSGQSATFNFTATATTTPGTYPFDWKMVEDTIEWFGATCSKTITVNAAPTCIPSCGSCSVSCGGGTQICVRVDCSTYSQACNTQACVSAPGNFRLSLGGSGAAACNSVPLSWTAASGADGYRIFRESPRVNISPYQPYTALNFIDTTVSQNTSYRYQIEAYNSGGTNRSNTISVDTPYCPPTLNLFAAPTSIYQGQSSTLSWATSYTTSCTASGGWSGSKPLNGSQLVVPLPPPSLTYNLQCSGPGGSVSGSVTINIAPLFLPDWVEIAPR